MDSRPDKVSPSAFPPAGSDLPERIGTYRILRRLATGGTSDLLLARDEGSRTFGRIVVLKLLLRQFPDDDRFEQMFVREASAYARLSHPTIVRLHDFFAEREELVLVLEFVDGLALNKLWAVMRNHGGELGDLASIFIGWRIFGALASAHGALDPLTRELGPVVHGDVNPSNVLIPWDACVKLADFGTARVAGMDGDLRTGQLKGTYGYMSPEQARGGPVTARADVYAASLLLWELLARRKAIVRSEQDSATVLETMAEPTFPPLDALRPNLPKALLSVVAAGLERNPDRRTMTAAAIRDTLWGLAALEDGQRNLARTLSQIQAAKKGESAPRPSSVKGGTSPPTLVSPPKAKAETPSLPALPAETPRTEQEEQAAQAGPVRRTAAKAFLFGAAVCMAIALLFWPRPHSPPRRVPSEIASAAPSLTPRVGHPEAPVAPARPVAPVMTPPATEAADVPSVPSVSSSVPARVLVPTSATLTISPARPGHRVWIDDRMVGESPGSFPVRCGPHTVRVGSQGASQHVDVACGTERVID